MDGLFTDIARRALVGDGELLRGARVWIEVLGSDLLSAHRLVQAALALASLARDPLDGASEAVAAVQQGSFLEPKNPLVAFTVGRVFESRGQLAEASRAYADAAGLDPSWASPPVAALALLFRQGDATAALAGSA